MRWTLQLIGCATAFWLAAPPTVTAEPIAVTSGVFILPTSVGGGPLTLTGTDGTRMFTFAGSISDIDPAPYACHPCVSQIGIDVNASGATHGTLTYGNESYRVGGGFLDTEGALALLIEGGPILLPAPVAAGEIRSFSTPFTASGLVVPPAVPGTGLSNTLTGSGTVTVTVIGGPGGEVNPLVWDFRSAEYRFSATGGGPAPIPEPTSFVLFASGLSALVLKRRWRTTSPNPNEKWPTLAVPLLAPKSLRGRWSTAARSKGSTNWRCARHWPCPNRNQIA